jgi:hypothetical protein
VRCGYGNHGRDGHDNPSWIGLDDQLIWTWEFDLLCFMFLVFSSASAQPFRKFVTLSQSAGY